MNNKLTSLLDVSIGKGEYGIGAPAVNKSNVLPTYLRITDINDDGTINFSGLKSVDADGYKKYLLEYGDVVFARTGNSTGRSYVYRPKDGNFVYAGFLIKFKLNISKVIPEYFRYTLLSSQYKNWIKGNVTGSTRSNINVEGFGKFTFKLPEISEQKRIADILAALDDKIELNNQMNQTLEEIASLLYKRWFVDFEFPDDKGSPYKSSGGEMVDSELGMIPKGWEVKNLTEIAKFVNGLAMQKFRPQISEESLPVLKIKELISNSVSKSTERCKKNIKDEVKVFDGDIIFSWSGTLAVKIWSGGEAGLNQHLFKVTSSIYPKWLYYLIVLYNLNNFKSIASDKATTMGHINRSHLEKTYFTIPQIKIIIKEYTYMETIIDKIIENKVSIKYLQETKEKVMLDLIQI